MTLNFKQPRYLLPLILFPFFCLFFYVFRGRASPRQKVKQEAGIQSNVGEVSSGVKKSTLVTKLDAFRNTYKESEGITAVKPVTDEQDSAHKLSAGYSDKQRRQLDSIDRAIKTRFSSAPAKQAGNGGSLQDGQVAAALNMLARQRAAGTRRPVPIAAPKEKDPMSVFRQQMAYVDSMQKANDPELKAENERRAAQARLLAEQVKPLIVHKAHENMDDFNTVRPQSHEVLIAAMIDEEVTAFAGSRIRLHLLEDIWAGQDLIRKGSCLYGLVTGFTAQRVNITVSSLLSDGRLLPVKLSVYDLDGMQGLYVPSSAFREFTKDLAGNTMQGVTIGNGSSGGQFLMSSVDKMFQSASSAIAGAIRKNKAKVKYGTYVYLLDPQILQNNH